MLRSEDEKYRKRIILTTIHSVGGVESVLISETFEEAYVSDYVEKYSLESSRKSGLVPFEIVIKELLQVDVDNSIDIKVENIIGPNPDDNSGLFAMPNSDRNDTDNNLYFNGTLYGVGKLIDNLSIGSKGEQVKELQNRLNEFSHESLIVDGDFGGKTEGAVNRFKETYGLGNTAESKGVVGQQTWVYLFPSIQSKNSNEFSDYNQVEEMVKDRLRQTNYYIGDTDYNSALEEFKDVNGISGEVGISAVTFKKIFDGEGTEWKTLPISELRKQIVDIAKSYQNGSKFGIVGYSMYCYNTKTNRFVEPKTSSNNEAKSWVNMRLRWVHLDGASKEKYWLDCSSFVSSVLVDAGVEKVKKRYTTIDLRDNCGFIKIRHEDVKAGDLFIKDGHVRMFIGNNEEAKQDIYKTIECRSFGGVTHAQYVQNVESNQNDIVFEQYTKSDLSAYGAYKILND